MQQPSPWKPAIIAGLVGAGLLSLPVLNLITICTCCAPLVGVGVFSAYLYSRQPVGPNMNPEFTAGDGALVGVLTGLVGGAGSAILGTLMGMGVGSQSKEVQQQLLQYLPQDDPATSQQIQDALQSVASMQQGGIMAFLGQLMFSLILFSVLCTLGGLLGTAFFRQRPVLHGGAPPSGGGGEDMPWE